VNWLRRLFLGEQATPRHVAQLDQPGELVELRGIVETLQSVILNPLDGSESVMLHYSARIFARADPQLGLLDQAAVVEFRQGVNFLLRDPSGVAMIEVQAGDDIVEEHGRLLAQYGPGIELDVETISPGDRIIVRGRVRERVATTSPHRSATWSAVIHNPAIERG